MQEPANRYRLSLKSGTDYDNAGSDQRRTSVAGARRRLAPYESFSSYSCCCCHLTRRYCDECDPSCLLVGSLVYILVSWERQRDKLGESTRQADAMAGADD